MSLSFNYVLVLAFFCREINLFNQGLKLVLYTPEVRSRCFMCAHLSWAALHYSEEDTALFCT